MANPIALASAIGRMVEIRCAHCGKVKLVVRRPKPARFCTGCHRMLPEPPLRR